jgi:hypothetical protein
MRAVLIILAAILFGLAGGYAWSAMNRPPEHVRVPKAVDASPPPLPASADDQAWSNRADESAPPPQPKPAASAAQSVHYAGCNEVRAAGKAPLHSDDPGYSPEMDGDGDGIACEPHHGA